MAYAYPHIPNNIILCQRMGSTTVIADYAIESIAHKTPAPLKSEPFLSELAFKSRRRDLYIPSPTGRDFIARHSRSLHYSLSYFLIRIEELPSMWEAWPLNRFQVWPLGVTAGYEAGVIHTHVS